MSVNFDFAFSEHYGFVDSLEKVERIIRDHELSTTTKFSLFKATRDFGRRGKVFTTFISIACWFLLTYDPKLATSFSFLRTCVMVYMLTYTYIRFRTAYHFKISNITPISLSLRSAHGIT